MTEKPDWPECVKPREHMTCEYHFHHYTPAPFTWNLSENCQTEQNVSTCELFASCQVV